MIEKYLDTFFRAFIYEDYMYYSMNDSMKNFKIDLNHLYYAMDSENDFRKIDETGFKKPIFYYTDYKNCFIKESLSQYDRKSLDIIKKFYFGYLVKSK